MGTGGELYYSVDLRNLGWGGTGSNELCLNRSPRLYADRSLLGCSLSATLLSS